MSGFHAPSNIRRSSPSRAFFWFLAASVVLWTIQNALLRRLLPVDSVESVCWGAKMAAGYFKHPPLAAWIAYACARLTNYADWPQHFLCVFCAAVGSWYAYKLAAEFFDECRAVLAGLILYSCHHYFLITLTFCPDPAQVALQPILAYSFYQALKKDTLWCWAAMGFWCGVAFLAKYSVGLLFIAMIATMLLHSDWRRRFAKPGPWLAVALFALIVCRNMLFLVQNDFICLKYVDDSLDKVPHVSALGASLLMVASALYPLATEAAVLLLGCLPRHFVLRRPYRVNREALLMAGLLTAIPHLTLIGFAVMGRTVNNAWMATMASWTGLVVVVLFPFEIDEALFRRVFRIMCAFVAVVFVLRTIDLMVRPRHRIHMEPQVFCQMVQEYWKAHSPNDIRYVIGNREPGNTLENYLPNHPVSVDHFDTVTQKWLWKEASGKEMLIINYHREKDMTQTMKILPQGCVPVDLQTIEVPYSSLLNRRQKTMKYDLLYVKMMP